MGTGGRTLMLQKAEKVRVSHEDSNVRYKIVVVSACYYNNAVYPGKHFNGRHPIFTNGFNPVNHTAFKEVSQSGTPGVMIYMKTMSSPVSLDVSILLLKNRSTILLPPELRSIASFCEPPL